jgi:TatD DNase family protein
LRSLISEDFTVAKVFAVCKSERKGVPKTALGEAVLVAGHGVAGDAHAGAHERQVSLLARESVAKLDAGIEPGAFGENIVTEGLDFSRLRVGARIRIGEAEVVLTRHGKECHDRCAIYEKMGDCIMPREGVFAQVVKGGVVRVGDEVVIL